MDEQHRGWVDIINRLHAALMAEHGYPGLARHRRHHREFAARVAELQEQLASGHLVIRTSLMSMMKEWLETHIRSEDRRFAEFVREQAGQIRH